MNSDVFISYSSKEYEKVKEIKEYLEKNEISCWLAPDSIPKGSNYSKEVPMIIYGVKTFLLILSENSQKSPWVIREIEAARNCNLTIVAYEIESTKINENLAFYISDENLVKAYNEEDSLDLLLKKIEEAMIIKNELKIEKSKPSNRDGQGKMTFLDGRIYEGEWKNREINGFGVMKYPDGVIYEGDWLDKKLVLVHSFL